MKAVLFYLLGIFLFVDNESISINLDNFGNLSL